MDPISAALGVGSLLSGFVGMGAQQAENRAARRFSRKMSDPAFIRKRAERAGFNPLLFVGPSAGLTTPAPGDAGGGALVAGMQGASEVVSAAQALALQKAELEMRNAELERINAQQQFGAAVPGVYGTTRGAPGDTGAVADQRIDLEDGLSLEVDTQMGTMEQLQRYGDEVQDYVGPAYLGRDLLRVARDNPSVLGRYVATRLARPGAPFGFGNELLFDWVMADQPEANKGGVVNTLVFGARDKLREPTDTQQDYARRIEQLEQWFKSIGNEK